MSTTDNKFSFSHHRVEIRYAPVPVNWIPRGNKRTSVLLKYREVQEVPISTEKCKKYGDVRRSTEKCKKYGDVRRSTEEYEEVQEVRRGTEKCKKYRSPLVHPCWIPSDTSAYLVEIGTISFFKTFFCHLGRIIL